MVVSDLREAGTGFGEVGVVLVRLIADWASVGSGEACCFEHGTGTQGECEDGSKVVEDLVSGRGIVFGEGVFEVFGDGVVWLTMEESGSL